ncbi:hypothetical protein [Halobacillus ihumii]|uniref:hypothetical protein n=1 Tax=Halobacillus ihumii TaxID=2686092 RepID=UPI0013D34787|nr:hypothetical protein [Halobacillus ihumii]
MGVILGRGDEAKEAIKNQGGGLDLKKAFVRLKAGESRKVRVLSARDYVAYKGHTHFTNGIFTQPCIHVAGERCLLCEAANYEGELVGGLIGTTKTQQGETVSEWAGMYAKKRVLFAFVDLEEGAKDDDGNPEGMLRVFDATKNQSDNLIANIDDYADELEDVAFTLKRTGEKNETTYSLNPIMPKKMTEVQATFDKWDGKEVPDKTFEQALQERTTEEQAKELQKAGFPVKDALGYEITEVAKDNESESEGDKNEDAGEPIDEGEDDPTKDF